jgi:mono/diheme cytochrome c family protein
VLSSATSIKNIPVLAMRNTAAFMAALFFLLVMPAWPAKLVEAPPPPPMPEGLPDEYEAQPKPPLAAGVMGLGQVLYETNCTSCHESVARVSARRKAGSLPELREQVARRSSEAKLQWSKEELEAVVRYLDDRHYQFSP